MTKAKKRAIVACSILLAVFLALGGFLLIWFQADAYPAFERNKKTEMLLPDLSDGFVPQGACALPENDEGYTCAVSGYYKDGVPSRIYLLGEQESYVSLTSEGEPLDTHFGGIAATKKYLFVTSGSKVVRVPVSDLTKAERGAAVEITDSFDAGLSGAFCSVYGNYLLVGEFYRAGNYETEQDHHIRYGDETNRALVYCFETDEGAEGGVGDTVPYTILSVRGLVQGIALTEESVYLSCSWGLADSTLERHKNPLGGDTKPHSYRTMGEREVPVYFLGKETKTGSVSLPSMSEGIYMKGERICVLFESACNKYRLFVRERIGEIVSLSDGIFA